jgi:hypothetical protein
VRPVADLRAFLDGKWRIERSMLDRRQSLGGRYVGEAEFAGSSDALLYREHGRLTFGSHEGSAEQAHLYDFSDGPSRASVYFRDGRAFHDLDLSQGLDLVSHICDPDLYEGRFMVLDDGRWQSAWKVTGPRKDQSIFSVYSRMS